MLVLGVDTCGPSGTVALARIRASIPPKQRLDGAPEGAQDYAAELLGQTELEGKTYSTTLISAVEELLTGHKVGLADVGAIVVVHGPGSFTGVRVGLSTVKGLAEPGQIPVVAVSRLAVLAMKAGVESAALDAHRHEVFLRVPFDGDAREILAGAEELAHISSRYGAPGVVGVCDGPAAEMVSSGWSGVGLARVEAPTAADAIGFCAAEILASHPIRERREMDGAPGILAGERKAGRFVDLAELDGHYLRRSDAEIFGEAVKRSSDKNAGIKVRRMETSDIDAVMEIVAKTDHAPRWARSAYVAAVDTGNQPRRVALVAERDGAALAGFTVAAVLRGGEAELESIVTALAHRRRGVARELFGVLKPELRRQGVREVMLEVREANYSAQGFYRFLGFREEGRRAGYYADPVEDAVMMRVKLS